MAVTTKRIVPSFWFDREAEQAARFYASVFADSHVGPIRRAGKAGYEFHGLPEGTVLFVEFELAGLPFIAINGGPVFKINPSVSFLIACDSKDEAESLWSKLSDGGSALMELGAYPFSEKYGWIQDKYGVSWQVMYMGERQTKQKITPTLMFVGAQNGRAEEAIHFYASLFRDSSIGEIMRYGPDQKTDPPENLAHAAFTLEGQAFAAMDSAYEHQFTFNEAVSLMVICDSQAEIDYYWEQLLAGGGQESVCGWLKDKFGFSWQVCPQALLDMQLDPDLARVDRVTAAFLKMKKFDLAELQKAFQG